MVTKHLTDEELQEYAFNADACGASIVEHVRLCEECRARAASYQLIMTGIREQSPPSFDFNLPELVISNLPRRRRALPENLIPGLLIGAGVMLSAIVIYVFRDYLAAFFGSSGEIFLYLVIPVFITVAGALLMDAYKNYHRKMMMLDHF